MGSPSLPVNSMRCLNRPKCSPRSLSAPTLSCVLSFSDPPVAVVVSETSLTIAASSSVSCSDSSNVTPPAPHFMTRR